MENIVKQTAKQLNYTYKQLAEALGVTEITIKRQATAEEVTQQIAAACKMLLEIERLNKDAEDVENFKMLLKKLTK